ncbi:MAG TPA: ATP-binding protein [Vicinamibacterales bacterium]|nr:ATP-binding protein [Vicinamibacterales bacterium]
MLVAAPRAADAAAIEAGIASSGCRLVRATDPEAARAALTDDDVVAALIDMSWPAAIELASDLRQRPRTQPLPLIFLADPAGAPDDELRAYRAGAVDWIARPVHPDVLCVKVAMFAALHRARRTAADRRAHRRSPATSGGAAVERHARVRAADAAGTTAMAIEASERQRDEFLAALAHELRNPLAPIRAAVELMQLEGTPAATLAHARDVVERQVEHLSRLIEDLVDLSRLTRDQLVLRMTPVALDAVVGAAVETSRPVVEERRHRLAVELPGSAVWLHADLPRLAQALSNIIINAAKYTPPGGDITIRARADAGRVAIVVRDTGTGIAADMLPRVFDMFVQDRRAAGATGGIGMGLTLAKRLIRMHGGTIEAESEGPGRGSIFRLELPVISPPAATPEPARPVGVARRVHRVLVVDDNADAAEMIVAMLSVWGQETAIAFDGASALVEGDRLHPDIVLLDIGLPQMDGYETARRMRLRPWGTDALLVAVTGWGQPDDRERTRAAGCDRHLVKPVAPAALEALLVERERHDAH